MEILLLLYATGYDFKCVCGPHFDRVSFVLTFGVLSSESVSSSSGSSLKLDLFSLSPAAFSLCADACSIYEISSQLNARHGFTTHYTTSNQRVERLHNTPQDVSPTRVLVATHYMTSAQHLARSHNTSHDINTMCV